MKIKLWVFIFLASISTMIRAQNISVIPAPAETELLNGIFNLDKDCSFSMDYSNEAMVRVSGFFNDYLKEYYGFEIKKQGGKKRIEIAVGPALKTGNEGYKLIVKPDLITVMAENEAGVFYGIQTLKQLLPATPGVQELKIPAVQILDQPRFKWRGNMLDVCRHFFPVSFIKEYIDILAMYKINTFHWHLTDDQGWRIEIKKYPKLNEISSWRGDSIAGQQHPAQQFDEVGNNGFYTQDQIKEIVKYAADRYITIVPEIEMPGHASAALAAFPNLGCTGGPYKVQTTWGVFKDVYCAGKDETFVFLQNVLDEVMKIFPSQYIHIGGDECPKDSWKNCPLCQKRIKDEGLKDENELQSYFVRRIDKYLSSKGRRLIGWDEILEGGLAPQAAVMSWRGINGGIAASKQHHNVVMSPTSNMYFDYYQSENKANEPKAIGGYLPLEKVYSFEPIPEELSVDEAKYILGVQANLWTEYITSTDYAEYMLLPRLDALAEVAWSPKKNKNYADFVNRLINEYSRLKMINVNFRDHRK